MRAVIGNARIEVLRIAGSRCVRTCVPISGAYIKEPFITRYARAGAAKKAAGCGEEARGASLSYLEPFPVNLGPPLSLQWWYYAHSSPHPRNVPVQRECTHAHAYMRVRRYRPAGPFPARVRSTLHLAASAARCCEPDNHFSLDDAPTIIFRE